MPHGIVAPYLHCARPAQHACALLLSDILGCAPCLSAHLSPAPGGAGEEVRTRACSGLKAAYLYATSPHMFAGASEEAFDRVRAEVRPHAAAYVRHSISARVLPSDLYSFSP